MLGPIEVRRDGERLAVPGGKTTELLVRLALAAGEPVRADRLVDDLWAGAPTHRNTLQPKVARLRRALGDPAAIPGGDDGYRLEVEPVAVDAHRVVRAAAAATAALDAGDPRRRRRDQRGHARAFGDELLPAAGDWAAAHRIRLEEARVQLLETQFSARLRLGDDVIGELEAAVVTAPPTGRAVGAADHRALPWGPAGGRARRLPARPRAALRRSRARAGAAPEGARA